MDTLTVNLLARVEQLEEAAQEAIASIRSGEPLEAALTLEQALTSAPD
jgi:hypothetical protein